MRSRTAKITLTCAAASLLCATSLGGLPVAAAATGGSTTLSWWVPGPDPTANTLTGAAAAFTKKTGIKVNVDITPWADYPTKITTAIASHTLPDIVEIGNTESPTFARTGAFYSWTPSMYNQVVGSESQLLATSNSVVGVPGQPAMSIPFMGQTWLLEYNKAMLKAAGIMSPPTTWASFLTDAKKLSDPAKGIYGIANHVGNGASLATWTWIIFTQFGGSLYNSSGQPDVTSAVDAKTLTWFLDWVYPDQIMNPALVADSTGTLTTSEFAEDKAAMLFTQTPQQAITDPSQYGIGLVPLPSPLPAGGTAVMSHVAGENLTIARSTKNLPADLEFIKFLLSPSEQEWVNQRMYELPVTRAGLTTPYFQTPAEKTFGKILSDYARPMPTEASSATLEEDVGNAAVTLFRQDIAQKGITQSAAASALSSVQASVIAAG